MRFTTQKELDQYLNQPTLTCLICGQQGFLYLAPHLRAAHGLSVREYKLQFNIPIKASLAAPSTRELHRSREEQRRILRKGDATTAARARTARKTGEQKPSRLHFHKYDGFDFTPVFDKIRKGELLIEALKSTSGSPSYETFNRMVKSDPSLKTQLDEVTWSLPYALQARLRSMSPKFRQDCRELHDRHGYSADRIGKLLGVSPTTVYKTLKDRTPTEETL